MELGNTLLLYGLIFGLPGTAILGAFAWLFRRIWNIHNKVHNDIELRLTKIEKGLQTVHNLVAETNHCGETSCPYCQEEDLP